MTLHPEKNEIRAGTCSPGRPRPGFGSSNKNAQATGPRSREGPEAATTQTKPLREAAGRRGHPLGAGRRLRAGPAASL